jgi:hypothetical protein
MFRACLEDDSLQRAIVEFCYGSEYVPKEWNIELELFLQRIIM